MNCCSKIIKRLKQKDLKSAISVLESKITFILIEALKSAILSREPPAYKPPSIIVICRTIKAQAIKFDIWPLGALLLQTPDLVFGFIYERFLLNCYVNQTPMSIASTSPRYLSLTRSGNAFKTHSKIFLAVSTASIASLLLTSSCGRGYRESTA